MVPLLLHQLASAHYAKRLHPDIFSEVWHEAPLLTIWSPYSIFHLSDFVVRKPAGCCVNGANAEGKDPYEKLECEL
ncbi:unnamed protein product [Orchesella dallaii]|uniref:Uncharacterized protein n=1 Tax=Orchesella dallaii TaxID=48710 RepID=A0ABP1QPN6_9HEXA